MVLLAAAAVASFFLLRDDNREPSGRNPAAVPDGYYLKDALVTGTDATGSVAYRLRAGTAEQVGSTDEVQLARIDLDYGQGDNALVMRAAYGRLDKNSQSLQLSGGVIIESRGEPPAALQTERLLVSFLDNQVQTDAAVTLRFAGGNLNAIGLTGDLKTQSWRLEREVRGRFGDSGGRP